MFDIIIIALLGLEKNMNIPGGVGEGRFSVSGCIKKGNRSLSLVNPKRGESGVTEVWVGDQGERTMVFLGVGAEHQNCPLGNPRPPLARSLAQQLG